MIVIDIRTDWPSNGLWARKIWEALFRETRAWEWEQLDSFLCDLKCFEELLDKRINIFWWNHENSMTNNYTQFSRFIVPCYKIIKTKDQIIITKVEQ